MLVVLNRMEKLVDPNGDRQHRIGLDKQQQDASRASQDPTHARDRNIDLGRNGHVMTWTMGASRGNPSKERIILNGGEYEKMIKEESAINIEVKTITFEVLLMTMESTSNCLRAMAKKGDPAGGCPA